MVYFRNIFFLLYLLWIAGCSTVPPVPSSPVHTGKGVTHKVQAGETLWRIAKTYNVSIEDLLKANNITNAAQIKKDQLIFIPGAERVKTIVLDSSQNGEFIWPIKGKVLSRYGERSGLWVNKGIDIEAKEGATLCAARSGRVVFADYLNGYAYTLILDHTDGFYSVYAQNSKLMVKLDDVISQGTPIALVGKKSGSPCLHFQIRKRSTADNPLYYLP